MTGTGGSRSRVLCGVLPLAAALAGCGEPPPAMPVTVRVGVFSVVDSLPYFVIREQGLDRRHGLRFDEETGFPGGAAVQDAMIADRVDIAPVVGMAPYLVAAEAGLAPGRVMAIAANSVADTTSKGIAIVANRSIKRWGDLEGGLIAVNALSSVSTPAVEGRLRAERVRSVKLVEIAPPNMGLAVAGGDVAAAAMLEPFITQSLLRGDGHLLGWVIGGSPFERMEMSMVVARTALYRERPEAVTRYIRAHLDAARWIAEHPEGARLLVAKIYALTPEIGRQITLLRWPVDGRHDFQSLEQVQQAYVKMGIVKRPLDLRRVIDERALEQARQGSSP